MKGCGGGTDFGGHFVFQPNQLCCAPADVAGECLRLGLTRCPFCGGPAGSGVDDRQVFFDVEAGIKGVLDGIDDPALGCADYSGAVTGNLGRLPQMIGLTANDCEIAGGSLAQPITPSAFPDNEVGLVAHLQEHVFSVIGGLRPVMGRRNEMLGVPVLDLRQGRQHLHRPALRHNSHLSPDNRFVGDIPRNGGLDRSRRRLCSDRQRRRSETHRCVDTAYRGCDGLPWLPPQWWREHAKVSI